MVSDESIIYSLPQRVMYTIVFKICGGPILLNHIVNGEMWDIVIPNISSVVRTKIKFEDDGDEDLKVEDRNGWLIIKIDGGRLIERDRNIINTISLVLTTRTKEMDDEEVNELEWFDEVNESKLFDNDEILSSLRTENLLLPHFSTR